MNDYKRLVSIIQDGATRSLSFQRLQLLSSAFKTHILSNAPVEMEAQSRLLGTDFYRLVKVDNHIHLAAAASAKQFVEFVQEKLETEPDTVVLEEGDTLREVFTKVGIDTECLTIDAFNVLADYSVYQRFDNFNSKYSPFKLAQMRRIFLKVNNAIEGRYFAELTKRVLARHEQHKGHRSYVEMRLSVYGMERNEWLQNAKWVLKVRCLDSFLRIVFSRLLLTLASVACARRTGEETSPGRSCRSITGGWFRCLGFGESTRRRTAMTAAHPSMTCS